MALPPKGAWKHLLSVGVKSLTKYPAAWPPIMVIVLAKICLILFGGRLMAPYVSPLYFPFALGAIYAPLSWLIAGYCLYGLLFSFAPIKWPHFLACMWRFFLVILLLLACLVGVMAVAGGLGFLVGYSRAHFDHVVVTVVLPVLLSAFVLASFFWAAIRLSFLVVIALAENRISLSYAWRLSRGWGGSLMACLLVIALLSAAVPVALFLVGLGADQNLVVGVTSITSAVTTLIYYAVIVTAYKKAVQDQPPVPLAVESF